MVSVHVGILQAGAIDVALDPSELDLDTATIAARYVCVLLYAA